MKVHTPWTAKQETHLGDPAWSIFEATGLRVAVGLTFGDAALICHVINNPVHEAAERLLDAQSAFRGWSRENPGASAGRFSDEVDKVEQAERDLRTAIAGARGQ